jgi:hypothetical protein
VFQWCGEAFLQELKLFLIETLINSTPAQNTSAVSVVEPGQRILSTTTGKPDKFCHIILDGCVARDRVPLAEHDVRAKAARERGLGISSGTRKSIAGAENRRPSRRAGRASIARANDADEATKNPHGPNSSRPEEGSADAPDASDRYYDAHTHELEGGQGGDDGGSNALTTLQKFDSFGALNLCVTRALPPDEERFVNSLGADVRGGEFGLDELCSEGGERGGILSSRGASTGSSAAARGAVNGASQPGSDEQGECNAEQEDCKL